MSTQAHLRSVIDIGSNSVRLVVYDTSQSPPSQIVNEKIFCGLARDLSKTGKLNPHGVAEALEGLIAYGALARHHNPDGIDVVGTAALRDAADGADFVRRVAAEAGLEIRIIEGEEEARYAALGVLALDPAANGIVADFGGGSLEFARVRGGEIFETLSRPYGAFRVMAMADRAAELDTGLRELEERFGRAPALHAIGGSWRALAQGYAQDMGDQPATLQGYTLDPVLMSGFCQIIAGADPEELKTRYGFEDKRATLAPASAFVLHRVLEILKPDKMVVSLAGIRDGILSDFLKQQA